MHTDICSRDAEFPTDTGCVFVENHGDSRGCGDLPVGQLNESEIFASETQFGANTRLRTQCSLAADVQMAITGPGSPLKGEMACFVLAEHQCDIRNRDTGLPDTK
jgi:hypothetical protein